MSQLRVRYMFPFLCSHFPRWTETSVASYSLLSFRTVNKVFTKALVEGEDLRSALDNFCNSLEKPHTLPINNTTLQNSLVVVS